MDNGAVPFGAASPWGTICRETWEVTTDMATPFCASSQKKKKKKKPMREWIQNYSSMIASWLVLALLYIFLSSSLSNHHKHSFLLLLHTAYNKLLHIKKAMHQVAPHLERISSLRKCKLSRYLEFNVIFSATLLKNFKKLKSAAFAKGKGKYVWCIILYVYSCIYLHIPYVCVGVWEYGIMALR